MHATAHSVSLTTITLAAAGLVLTACGSQSTPNTQDDHATHSAAPTEMPATPAIPTSASVQAYCDAFNGDATKLAGVDTTGEAADAFDDLLDHQRKVGTPPDMPQEARQVFIDYLKSGGDFVAALRKLPADSPVSAMRTNKEFYAKWGGKLETPQELRDYSAKNCP